MHYILLPLALIILNFMYGFGQPFINSTSVWDDFSTVSDYTDPISSKGIYWWASAGVNSVTHDTTKKQLIVRATQAAYQYVPFGVGFGDVGGVPNTIDLTNDGTWSFDITNYGTEDLFIRVACQDDQQRLVDCNPIPNPNNLAFDNLNVWAYQVQILVPTGKTVTFKSNTPNDAGKGYVNNCDFSHGAWGYWGTWDPQTQTHIGAEVRTTCDMSRIQGINITPMNAAKNTTDGHALELINGHFGISNFRVGKRTTTNTYSENYENSNAFFLYPNPSSNFVNLHVPTFVSGQSLTIKNALGEVVYYQNIEKNSTQMLIDTSPFSSGIYSVSIGSFNSKLSITK